jgi:hypothetical protein
MNPGFPAARDPARGPCRRAAAVLGLPNALDPLFFLFFYVSETAGGGRESLYIQVVEKFPKSRRRCQAAFLLPPGHRDHDWS